MRTVIPSTLMAQARVTADPAGVALDPTNGHVVNTGDGQRLDKTLLRITATDVGGTVTIPTRHAGYELTHDCPAGTTLWIGPFESATYRIDPDGGLLVDVSEGMSGTVAAVELGRS